MRVIRQGDLMLVEMNGREMKTVETQPNRILLRGEQSNHVHQVFGNAKFGMQEFGNTVYIESDGTAEVRHVIEGVEELVKNGHETIIIPKGKWLVYQQEEYTDRGYGRGLVD